MNPLLDEIIDEDVRRCLAHVFPYAILYTIETDYLLIVAVMHRSHEPVTGGIEAAHPDSRMVHIAEPNQSVAMLVLLGALIFIYNLGLGILNARGLQALPSFEFLYLAMFYCGVVWWLRAETGNSPVTQIYCPGLMAITAWPIIIPYHLLKTRGIKGLLPLLALIGTFIFARLLATIIFLAVAGF